MKEDTPTIYMGEASRSVFERSKDYWGAWRSRKDDSHILQHQTNDHGRDSFPQFIMRVVSHNRLCSL